MDSVTTNSERQAQYRTENFVFRPAIPTASYLRADKDKYKNDTTLSHTLQSFAPL